MNTIFECAQTLPAVPDRNIDEAYARSRMIGGIVCAICACAPVGPSCESAPGEQSRFLLFTPGSANGCQASEKKAG